MIKEFIGYLRTLALQTWNNREITWELARRDLKRQYKGAALGIIWAAAQPMLFVFVFWFAVEIGLRGDRGTTGGFPFILWLIPAMFAWRVIASTLSMASNSVQRHRELVTKVVFPSITIPQFSVLSLFLIHVGLMVFAIVIFIATGNMPTIYWLQIPYVVAANFVFCVVLAILLSALTTYSRDLFQMIKVSTTGLFWFTPIIWPITNVVSASETLGFILRLNPIAYLIEAYRWAMIYGNWFWEHPLWSLYFWGFVLVLFCLAVFIWGRLSRYFADVL